MRSTMQQRSSIRRSPRPGPEYTQGFLPAPLFFQIRTASSENTPDLGILPSGEASSANTTRSTSVTLEYYQSVERKREGISGLKGVLGLDFFHAPQAMSLPDTRLRSRMAEAPGISPASPGKNPGPGRRVPAPQFMFFQEHTDTRWSIGDDNPGEGRALTI